MTHLAFEVVAILGRLERGAARPQDEALLRLLTPIAKLTTGKSVVTVVSETLECFGGAGYVEDTGLPVGERVAARREDLRLALPAADGARDETRGVREHPGAGVARRRPLHLHHRAERDRAPRREERLEERKAHSFLFRL